MEQTEIFKQVVEYFKSQNITPAKYQIEAWQKYFDNTSLLINAPTGSGKTITALFADIIKNHQNYKSGQLNILWITPLRSLTKDIAQNLSEIIELSQLKLNVADRTSDTSFKNKKNQIESLPNILVTTPESLNVLFTNYGYKDMFKNLSLVVVDEWHEFLNTKRGVLTQLGINNLNSINNNFQIIGLSATIGNMETALDCLIPSTLFGKRAIIGSELKKDINFEIAKEEDLQVAKYGHTGLRFLNFVADKIKRNNSTIIFTNTRSQTEIWYQKLIEILPEFDERIFVHHASIDKEQRFAVENSLKNSSAKAVVATASLDLGVNYKNVDCIIQIGSPKGIARFVQRAGRSGRGLEKTSKIVLVPTNEVEYIDGVALEHAAKNNLIESKYPLTNCIDVLSQYLVTLACSYGFNAKEMYLNIKNVYSYSNLTIDQFNWVLKFITTGGEALKNYPQFKKVEVQGNFYKVNDSKIIRRHKLSIGVISESPSILIKLAGKTLGTVEESFLRGLNSNQPFVFGGSTYRLIGLEGSIAKVKLAKSISKNIPVWQGGRMPLSNEMSNSIEQILTEFNLGVDFHLDVLKKQARFSVVPDKNNFVIESVDYRDGYYIFMYPIAGKTLHDGLAAILAYRIGKVFPATFSILSNDYGFELFTDRQFNIKDFIENNNIFSTENLFEDIKNSINLLGLAKRKFRNIADVSGLVFKGYPGEASKFKNLQMSTELLFDVLTEFDKENLLLKQAYDEVLEYELNINRIKEVLGTISKKNIIYKNLKLFSPFALPIVFERFRHNLTTETLEDRIKRMGL